MTLTKQNKYTFVLLLAAFIWGIGFVAQRAAMGYMGPLTFNAIRFGVGGLLMIPVALKLEKGGFHKVTLIAGLSAGGVLFISAALQQWGIMLTGSASKAGFITGLYIIIVPILGIFMGKKTSKYVWVGAILATIGMFLISTTEELGLFDIGTMILFLCAIGWAFHILVIDKFVDRVQPLSFSVAQCLVCSVLSFAFMFILEDPQMQDIAAGWLPLAFAALISVGVAYTLQIIGQRHVSPSRSAIVFSTESVFGALAEAVILGTLLSMQGYIGGAFILAGIVVSQLRLFLKKR